MTYQFDEKPSPEDLVQFGVRGMRWGVRKDGPSGVSNKTNREARKDAEEFSRAKMFYGKGAGNRRKLIKNTVEAKSSRDPNYKKAFDHHLGNQDMSTHASKARTERKRTDRKEKTVQRAGFFARRLTGEMGTQAAFAAAVTAGAVYAKSPQARAAMSRTVKNVSNSPQARAAVSFIAKNTRG